MALHHAVCLDVNVLNMKKTSKLTWKTQELLAKKMQLKLKPMLKTKSEIASKVQLKLKRKRDKLELLPLSKFNLEDKEFTTFLELQVKKTRRDRVVLNRKLKQEFNLTKREFELVWSKTLEVKQSIIRYVSICERVRRLLLSGK